MVVKSLPVTALACWLTLSQFLLAQFPQFMPPPPPPPTVVTPDNPSHRYLPPPVGKASLSEKVRALEQLSQSQVPGSEQGRPPLGLSPAQLKQLDTILDSFRDEKGQLNLPSPDSVPKEWVDSILTDPKQRQQAKEMLEQYSRSRNIPLQQDATSALPPIDSQPSNSSSDRSSSRKSASDNRSFNPAGANRPNGQPSSGNNQPARSGQSSSSASNSGQSSDSPELPKDIPPQLRQLYETLKQFQRQQQQTGSQPANRGSRDSGSNSSNRNGGTLRGGQRGDQRSGQRSRDDYPNSRQGTAVPRSTQQGTAVPRSSQQGTAVPRSSQQDGDEKNAIDQNTLNSDTTNDRNGNSTTDPLQRDDSSSVDKPSGQANTPDANTPNANTPNANTPTLTPFDEGFDFSKDQQVPINPFLEPDEARGSAAQKNSGSAKASGATSKPFEPFNVTRMAQEPRSESRSSANARRPTNGNQSSGNQSSGNQGADKPGFDLRKSVNELGLGPALKRIVQKTLEKQGLDSSPVKTDPKLSNPSVAGAGGNLTLPDASNALMPGSQATKQLTNWTTSVAQSTNNPANNSTSQTNTQWGNWMRDTWRSIADATTRSQSGSSGSSSSTAASSGASFGELPEFRWTGSMTAAVIIFAALVGMLVWFSRRAVTETSDAASVQAEWVRTVMAQGLKTRADVIRAFHHLVKQSRSVSDWWTHRSIVRYFSAQTPQLATAIDELAVVYEQARYYPEDVELSPQQLAHVRTLLESVKIPASNR